VIEMKATATALAAVVDVALVRQFAIVPVAADTAAPVASATMVAEGVSMKWLLYCQEPANAHSSMRQVPCVLRRDVTCAAAAAHARDAVETTALSDSIWMVARASAVPRGAAAVLTVAAPAALVAPA
jgi:hypothetical protein